MEIGEPASDLDIAIPRGRWKLDSQYRYAYRSHLRFYGDNGKDEGSALAT